MSMRTILSRFAVLGALGLALTLVAVACDDDEGGDGTATATTEPQATDQAPAPTATDAAASGELSLTSSAFADNEAIPVKYTCDGDNVSPPLAIGGVPEGAATLALIVDDPDAPSGSFVHWTVYNIDPTTEKVAEGLAPGDGTEGLNGTGQPGYTGPCPPSGTHRYIFTLYALDVGLNLDAAASGKEELEAAMAGHIVAQTELTGTYAR
ncbi:MAG: YbhB/YbcL family Raf kinase inhibitor-like protein [Dehalococcoidia bacterium]